MATSGDSRKVYTTIGSLRDLYLLGPGEQQLSQLLDDDSLILAVVHSRAAEWLFGGSSESQAARKLCCY